MLVTLLFIKIYIFFHFLSIRILLSILKELYYILALKKPKYLYSSIFYSRAQFSFKTIRFLS